MRIQPITENFGVEGSGVDLSAPMDEALVNEIISLYYRHSLLLFRQQNLSPSDQARLAHLFGKPKIETRKQYNILEHPEVSTIGNIRDPSGKPLSFFAKGGFSWHTDGTAACHVDAATFLYAVELPSAGGHTLFGNGYRAYDSLPADLKKEISGRRVLQVYDYTVREKPSVSGLDHVPHCWQPAVIRHPVTGRCALYVDRLMSAAIEGLPRDQSAALLEALFPYIERADYEHVWRPGDYVIWDNRCSVHARTDFPATERRLLKRGKVAGEPLTAAQ